MKTKKDCGLTAMAWVVADILGKPYDEVYNHLKTIMEYDDNDLDDNPAEHERVINEYAKAYPEFNLNYNLIKPIKEQLFSGKLPNNRTIILVHDTPNLPKLIKSLFGLLKQHWCILHSIQIKSRHVIVWWGDGTLRKFSFSEFEDMLINATPQCVYTIGVGEHTDSNPWYSKLYAFIINVVEKIKSSFRK
ncbi:MAG: hypothetical protein CVT92_02415 [Bacteroidetes bacterium HGW-Bacteroidetes-1]|nr:MAG: hypothetical protein CVT92_02415 [Bacteroidetes bacterium HGW-Bacteroidetes-1]